MNFILGFISFCLVLLYLILEWLDDVYSSDCSFDSCCDFNDQPDSAVPSLPPCKSHCDYSAGGEISP